MRLLVTGSRHWADRDKVFEVLDEVYDRKGPLVVVHGACPSGADHYAKRWVRSRRRVLQWQVDEDPHPANWRQYGDGAGPIRNQEMVDTGADLCLAFLTAESKGTYDCIARARRAGIPVEVVRG